MEVVQSCACAGVAAVATVTILHPIDTVKTRMQVSGSPGARNYRALGVVGTIRTISTEEGFRALYKGISAAWCREASYSSLRLGLYAPCKKLVGAEGKNAPTWKLFGAGSLAGAIG